jgi:hypothetical protein
MYRDTHEPNDTTYYITESSETFLFFRVAAAVVFDVSRTQTFQSVSKVSNKIVCKLWHDVELSILSFSSLFPIEIPQKAET